MTSLNPLINHKKLRLVSIFSCYGITKQEITTLKKARPNIYIDTEESNDNENNTENENQKKNALKQHEMF